MSDRSGLSIFDDPDNGKNADAEATQVIPAARPGAAPGTSPGTSPGTAPGTAPAAGAPVAGRAKPPGYAFGTFPVTQW